MVGIVRALSRSVHSSIAIAPRASAIEAAVAIIQRRDNRDERFSMSL
jgi:hypothetical protein